MKRLLLSVRFSAVFCGMVVLATLIGPQGVPDAAAQVQASVGAQSGDKGKQALAFLPNELWIHVGDSVTWTFATAELHTVTFLRTVPAPQARPQAIVGCPGTTSDGSPETSASCINSGMLAGGPTYTVRFPAAGNFKLVCLVHVDMTGVVHVLDLSETLPHDQAFYDRQAQNDRAALLSDGIRLERRGIDLAEQSFRGGEGHEGDREGREGDDERHNERTSGEAVTAGISEIVSTTGGGVHTEAVMRFLRDKTVVHVGDTVEWTNLGPIVPHTVTFGIEPANLMPPSAGVTVDSDGTRHAVIGSPTDNVNSGFLIAAPQERVGLPQSPQAVTRFRVTFTSPGTYNYICGLHDDLGMTGTVTVIH